MLLPASPPGRPHPRIRSSMVFGSSAGTLSRAAWTISAERSSGRNSLSEPLLARPMGVRAALTITASGIEMGLSICGGSLQPTSKVLWEDRQVRHTYSCPLRWADMDLLAHVNNVTYVDYLQEARIDMLVNHAPVRGGEDLAEGVVVVRHEVDYLAPLVYRAEPVTIETWVTEVRAATFTMAYEVFDAHPDGTRTVYLRARSVLTPYVFADERPRRLSAREREVLGAFLEQTPP